MNKGLLMGLFVVAIIHAFVSIMFALEYKAYFWYASFLASIVVANIIGHHPVVNAELKRKDG